MSKPEIRTKPRMKRIKKYADYQVESEMHYPRIISNYGMPPKCHVPSLPEDIIERVINQSKMTPRMWNGSA